MGRAARTLAKNLLTLSVTQIISQFTSFFIIIYLARVLGAENFGKISFAQAVCLYFTLVANLGLTVVGVREVARNKNNIEAYTSNIIALRLVLAIFSFCLLLIFVNLIHKSSDVKYLITIYGLFLFPSALLIEWLFQGVEKMEIIGVARILNKVLYAGLIFLLVKGSAQLLVIPYAWLAGSFIAVGFLFYIFIRRFGRVRLSFDFPFWRSLLRQALPMGASFIMIQIYYQFDTIMLGFMKGDEVVGWYSAAYKVIFFIWALLPIFVSVIFPRMSKYYKESRPKLRTLISLSTKMLSVVALPLGVGGMILAKPIMGFLYGEEFSNGIIAFQILIWSVVIISIRCTYEQSFLACNEERRYMWGVMLGAGANIGLNMILIPYFGLKGAAIATVISELVFSLYMLAYFRILKRMEIIKYPLKPIIAAGFMGFIIYYFRDMNLFFLLSLGFGVYSVFIFLLRGITFKELAGLKQQIMAKR